MLTFRTALLLLPLAVFTPRVSRAQSGTVCLAALQGTWRGAGTVLGRAIVMEQKWSPVMRGAFTELAMRHLATDTSSTPQFEGRGFYRAAAAGSDSITGSWFDARGYMLMIAGSCRDGVFSSLWSGVERGRTTYAVTAGELVVIDSVYPPNAAAREFGRSVLRRVAPSPP